MLTGGCACFGFALAFALEFVLDRSVKRPSDIETKLRLPLLMSIPHLSRNGHRHSGRGRKKASPRLKDVDHGPVLPAGEAASQTAGAMAVSLWDRGDALRRFCEGLRDRVIIDFEVKNLSHKPKLVAVTSCNHGAGVSSIATGLAGALSESGTGNVLLVDMNDEQGRAKRFHKGKASGGAEERLEREAMKSPQADQNLYPAAEGSEHDRLPSVLPRGFANLMPALKASDYDYIVFDMPPVSQTSMTARLAGIMDTVLLVVESEKTNQEAVQQASAILAKSKANVTTVLNKVRKYIPDRLYQEFLSDT
jgi:Mrp family chromosome partitioning ATPase